MDRLLADPLPTKTLPFDEKISKIRKCLPEGSAEKILSQRDRIEGEKKQLSVMFCNLEGFTDLSKKLGPEGIYALMDQLYEILIRKVSDFGGTVNEVKMSPIHHWVPRRIEAQLKSLNISSPKLIQGLENTSLSAENL